MRKALPHFDRVKLGPSSFACLKDSREDSNIFLESGAGTAESNPASSEEWSSAWKEARIEDARTEVARNPWMTACDLPPGGGERHLAILRRVPCGKVP